MHGTNGKPQAPRCADSIVHAYILLVCLKQHKLKVQTKKAYAVWPLRKLGKRWMKQACQERGPLMTTKIC